MRVLLFSLLLLHSICGADWRRLVDYDGLDGFNSILSGGVPPLVLAISGRSTTDMYFGGTFSKPSKHTAITSICLTLYLIGDMVNGLPTPPISKVARWNSSVFSALTIGSGAMGVMGLSITALAANSSSDVYMGGAFTNVDACIQCRGVARWTGSSWAPLASGILG